MVRACWPAEQRPGALQAGEAGEEGLHVTMPEHGRIGAAVSAPGQVLRQQPDRADDRPHRPGCHRAERLGRPCLGCLLQPRLADGTGLVRPVVAVGGPAAGKRQPPPRAPQAQVPDILGPLGLQVGAGQADPVRGKGKEPAHRRAGRGGPGGLGGAAGSGAAQVAGHVPESGGHDPPPLGQRRLDAVEDLGDHALVESGEHHPPGAVPQAR